MKTSNHATIDSTRPLDHLITAVRSKRTGEFVFASSEVEVHVYLQKGRVAWATDSRRPLEFMRRLMKRQHIDAESIRQVIESCRRDRLPLGETLVEWGLASLDDVREALHEQLSLSLVALSSQAAGSSLFLDRPQFRSYDERLTFEVSSLLKTLSEPPRSAETDGSGEPFQTGVFPAVQAPLPLGRLPLDAQALAAATPYASFVLTTSLNELPDVRVPGALERTLGDQVDFVALRATGEGTVGFVAPSGDHVFAGYTGDIRYGLLLLSLAPFMAAPPEQTELRASLLPRGPARGDLEPELLPRLEEVFNFGPGILALAVLSASGGQLYSIERSSVSLDWLEPARTQPELLRLLLDSSARFGMGVGAHWIFGAALDDGSGRSIWALIDRSAPQGLGWAALTSALGRTAKKKHGSP